MKKYIVHIRSNSIFIYPIMNLLEIVKKLSLVVKGYQTFSRVTGAVLAHNIAFSLLLLWFFPYRRCRLGSEAQPNEKASLFLGFIGSFILLFCYFSLVIFLFHYIFRSQCLVIFIRHILFIFCIVFFLSLLLILFLRNSLSMYQL